MLRTLTLILAFAISAVVAPLAQTASPRDKAKPTQSAAIVNINTASSAELEALPGIGPKVAARIIDYRKTKGPFKKIEELMNVQGIGEKSFLKLRSQVTVGPKADAAGQD